MKSKIKKAPGDILEMKLRDSAYNPIYKNEADTRDIKKLSEIIEDMENRGIEWFKATERAKQRKYGDKERFW